MMFFGRQVARSLVVYTVVASLGVPIGMPAQTHVVSPEELQAAVLAATDARQKSRTAIAAFLSTPNAERALRAARLDPKQVKTAVSSLNDEELARLAARTGKAQADFAAGRLTERDLLLILVGLAALILIIVAVD